MALIVVRCHDEINDGAPQLAGALEYGQVPPSRSHLGAPGTADSGCGCPRNGWQGDNKVHGFQDRNGGKVLGIKGMTQLKVGRILERPP